MKLSFAKTPYRLPADDHETGRRIREARMAKGWSQTHLGGLLDVSKQTVSAWEVGDNPPTLDNLKRFAALMKINVGDLL